MVIRVYLKECCNQTILKNKVKYPCGMNKVFTSYPKAMAVFLMVILSSAVIAQHPSVGGYHVYYGHLHNHTSYSDGLGTPAQAYAYARDNAHLDFLGLADHTTANSYDISPEEWDDTRIQANAFNMDGAFVTFFGFEWTHDTIGHVTVVNADSVGHRSGITDFASLVSWLSGRDAVAFFNHPGRCDSNGIFSYNSGITPSLRFVGMELWNTNDGFPVYYDNNGYTTGDNRGNFDEALANGWMIGAAGSGDEHGNTWGKTQDCRLAILADHLTREDLYAALKARRFYSTLESDIRLSFKMNGREMGSSIPAGPCALQIEAVDGGGESFTTVVLYDRNRHRLKTWKPGAAAFTIHDSLTVSAGDYYYVKVIQADSSGMAGQAISSPLFVSSMKSDGNQTFMIERDSCIIIHSNVSGGMPPYSYQWSPAAGLSSATASDPVACPADSIVYHVTVTDAIGCIITKTVTVNIDPLPGPAGDISGLTSVCRGSQAVIYSVPAIVNATSYAWTLPEGATGSSSTNSISVAYGSMAVSGNISVHGYNAYGDGIASTLAIMVTPAFSFTEEHRICKGGLYHWQGGVYGEAGIYTIGYSTVNGCDSLVTLDLKVDSVDVGVTASGTTASVDSSADAYQWLDCDNNFAALAGETRRQFTAVTSGHYAVSITRDLCTDTSSAISIMVYPSYSFTEDKRICKGEILHWQGADYTTSATYIAAYTSVHGNDSIYTLNLGVDSVDVAITVDGITLVADSAADAYQWFDCHDGYYPISGATDREFTAPIYGNFAVRVTRGLCSDTSACVFIWVEGMNSAGAKPEISFYPNPADDMLTITGIKQFEGIELYNICGYLLLKEVIRDECCRLNVGFLNAGTYIVKLISSEGEPVRKTILVLRH